LRRARQHPLCRFPYEADSAHYAPDFIVVTDKDQNVIDEIKGQVTDNADAKAKGAERWYCRHAAWTIRHMHYRFVTDPGKLGIMLNSFTEESWVRGEFSWL
jgi:type III restriction enzyme